MSSPYTHCPKCGHTNLTVSGTAELGMRFTPGDPDGQVDSVDSYNWEATSLAACDNCRFTDALMSFEHDTPWQTATAPDEPFVWTESNVLQAIHARINGVFDDPCLMKLGPLSPSPKQDVQRLIELVTKGVS